MPHQRTPIMMRQPCQQPVLAFGLGLEKLGAQRGDNRYREEHHAHQCKNHGQPHRTEHLALNPTQCENGHIRGDNDKDSEQGGANHLHRAVMNQAFTLVGGQLLGERAYRFREAANRVFHNNHRAVHQQSEVYRAQTHQVRGHPKKTHADHCPQHRERDDAAHNKPCPQLEQKQKEQPYHQQAPFGEVGQHRAQGAVHQFGALQMRYQFRACGE
ncbi:hypothetical protein HRbin14_02098 [bacterium HR14]|nr:hypothetical protein HRbin14_02098 [bacterium HR14]